MLPLRAARALPVIALTACGPSLRSEAPADGRPDVRYRIAPSPDLSAVDETLCFAGDAPDALIPGTPDGLGGLVSARVEGGAALPFDAAADTALALPDLPPDACVSLALRLPAEPSAFDVPYASRAERAVVLPVGYWLWRPTELEAGFSAAATLELAPGMAAAVPWTRRPDARGYLLPAHAFWRSGLAAWSSAGSTAIQRRALGEDVLEIVGGPPELMPPPATTARWVEAAAREMLILFGHFRGGHLMVVLRGVPALEAVPFGQTFRGGGPAVALLVSNHLTSEAAKADWVAVHEVFHTGLPVMRPEDAWLFEGLASYYQNVLRVRGGRLTPAEAWAFLSDGFARGAGVQTGRTLAEESRDMPTTHAYWPVYWGGALWALRMDLALRRLRPGSGGLDDVMRRWFTLDDARAAPWSAEALLDDADTALGLDGLLAREAAATLGRADFLARDDVDGALWQEAVFGKRD